MLAEGLPIGKRLAELELVDEARAVIAAMQARGADGADAGRRRGREGVQGRCGGDGEARSTRSLPTT